MATDGDKTGEIRTVDFTYDELLEQNRSLSEELTQCRADKDFVWTLWKRLQAEKPEVTSVVSMVVTREQEKAEAKDKKVLEILKEKDSNIKILEEIAADLKVQLRQSMERLSGLLVEQSEWQTEMEKLQAECEKLKEEKEYQQEVLKGTETQKEAELNGFLQRIEELEKINAGSETKILELESEVDKLSKETSAAATVMEANAVLRDKVKVLEQNLELTKKEYEEKICIVEARESQLLAETAVVSEQQDQIEQNEMENSSLRLELKKSKSAHKGCLHHLDEQNNIIRNLELLQDETQQVLKNQQDSHKAEVVSYKNTLNELRMKCLEMQSANEQLYGDTEILKQSLSLRQRESLKKEEVIVELEQTLNDKFKRMAGYDSETQTVDLDCIGCRESEEIIENLKGEIDHLQDIVHEKARRVSSLEKVLGGRERRRSSVNNDRCIPKKEGNIEDGQNKFRILESHIDNLNELLTLKDDELSEMRKAHGQRLSRYKTLQKNYSMVTQQLRTFEQGSDVPHPRNELRADPRSLQHENSDSVWNELAIYRRKYESLLEERDNIKEELDGLRVQNSHYLSSVKELKIYLQQEQEESLKLKREAESKERMVSPSKVFSMEKQLEIFKQKARDYETNLEEMVAENMSLKQKERYYKTEVMNLTDEIDHIHKNIKNKIDAEVQACEFIEGLERKANKSLETIANSIAAQTDIHISEKSPVSRRLERLIEQTSQTSPRSPYKYQANRYIDQSNQSTQTADNYTSSESEDSDSSFSPVSQERRPNKVRADKSKASRSQPMLNDLKTPRRKNMAEKRRNSPGRVMLPQKRKGMPPKSSPIAREHASLKHRVLSLQQQVHILRDSKLKLSQNIVEQQTSNEQLKGELSSASKKLDVNKMRIQKLSAELEKCVSDRDDLGKELAKERKRPRAPEIGYKEMENRWKLSTTECSKLAFQVRTLRGENDMMNAKQKDFHDRILRLERQLNQKKEIIEELREKLKSQNTASAREKDSLEEIKKKNKELNVKEEQRKAYVEDLRDKINQLSTEKLKLQENLQLAQEELKRKSRLLRQSQELCNQAEKAVNEMEKAAFDQLQDQASQHEKSQMKVNEKLNKEYKRIKEYQFLIKCLAEDQLKESHKVRVLISERRKRRIAEQRRIQNQKESMVQARDIACSILDMSSNDLQSFMEDESNDEVVIETYDNELREKLDEQLKKESKFSKPLLKCLIELIHQNWKLRLQEYQELNSFEGEIKKSS